MACRIGITTNPSERRRAWEREHPRLYGWEILGRYSTKSAAQAAEYRLAAQHGCESSPGGAGQENDNWRVYKFHY